MSVNAADLTRKVRGGASAMKANASKCSLPVSYGKETYGVREKTFPKAPKCNDIFSKPL
jgi:hypothetical protein